MIQRLYLKQYSCYNFFFQNRKVEVSVSDFEGNGFGYVYFFQSLLNYKGVPLLKSDAGQKLVNYDFKLTAGYLE